MNRLHFYNPENDLALASGLVRYTPPSVAVRMRRAGCLLPLFWADEGDAVLVIDDYDREQAERIVRRDGLKGRIVEQAPEGFRPDPWGWSSYTAEVFRRAGVDEGLLPSARELEQLRQLSHRRTSIEILRRLGVDEGLLPVEARSVEEALAAVKRFGEGVVKQPWSCSGRGVFYSGELSLSKMSEIISGTVRRQGSVIVEPRFERRQDFAMLFRVESGNVRFHGYSLFQTLPGGFYSGNVVAPQEFIASKLPTELTEPLIPRLEQILAELIPAWYDGWAGIDMLTYSPTPELSASDAKASTLICPCIELNLRRTMGVAALAAAGRIGVSDPLLLNLSSPDFLSPLSDF